MRLKQEEYAYRRSLKITAHRPYVRSSRRFDQGQMAIKTLRQAFLPYAAVTHGSRPTFPIRKLAPF